MKFRYMMIGALVGVVLMFSGQALAEQVSKIGKKVQAEHPVKVGGKQIEVTAINVGGTTYSPNRALAEEFGYDIEFKDDVVIFTKKDGGSQMESELKDDIESQLEALELEIGDTIREQYKYTPTYTKLKYEEWDIATPERKVEIEKELAELEKLIGPLTNRITELVDRKATLEAQKAALQ